MSDRKPTNVISIQPNYTNTTDVTHIHSNNTESPPIDVTLIHQNNTNVKTTDVIPLITTTVIECALIMFICTGNGLVLAAGWRFAHLRTPAHTFLFSLSLADFSAGFLALPVRIAVQTLKSLHPETIARHTWLCHVMYFVGVMPVSTSAMTIVAMSVDRCVSICTPLKYRAFMTNGRAVTICAVVWCINVVEYVVVWFMWVRQRLQETCDIAHGVKWPVGFSIIIKFTLVKVWILAMYVVMLVRASRSARTARGEGMEVGRRCGVCCAFIGHGRAFRTVVTVLGVYALCTAPLLVTIATRLVMDYLGRPITDELRIAVNVSVVMAVLNSGINPIIYHANKPAFRQAFVTMLGCGKGGQTGSSQGYGQGQGYTIGAVSASASTHQI